MRRGGGGGLCLMGMRSAGLDGVGLGLGGVLLLGDGWVY